MKLTPYVYTSEAEKRRDFVAGVVGTVLLNIVLAGLYVLATFLASQLPPDSIYVQQVASVIILCLGLLPWVVNLVVILFFSATRSQVAKGALVTILIVLAIAFCLILLAGIILLVICFSPRR